MNEPIAASAGRAEAVAHPVEAAVPLSTGAAPAVMMLFMLVVAGVVFARLAVAPPPHAEMAGFATSLKGRTGGQRHNAVLSAQALNGKVIAPGAVFSFNRAVGSWTLDRGYLKAPVSYDGELIRAYGGGVCQTSTTLYNAALLAGLQVVERHPHVFRPRYIAPGRDAAVAFPGVDLRLRNPYSWPVRIRTRVKGSSLEIRFTGARPIPARASIITDVVSVTQPARLTRRLTQSDGSVSDSARSYLRSAGQSGYRVVTYRNFHKGKLQRERLSDDTYPAMNRIIVVSD